jgi:thiol-disulfide isomerase/thioredoxin
MFVLSVLLSFGQAREVPDFSLRRMDNGASFTKANMTPGKKSLFIFFDPGCGHCQDAMKEYEANNGKLNEVGIYLVTRENKEVAGQFLSTYAPTIKRKKNMVLLQDRNNNFIAKFLPKKFPSMFLFGKNNQLILYSDELKDIPAILESIAKK